MAMAQQGRMPTPSREGVAGAGPSPAKPSADNLGTSILFMLPALLARTGVAGTGTSATAEDPEVEPGQVLVLWSSDEAAADGLAVLAQRYQLQPDESHALRNLTVALALVTLPTQAQAQALRDQLRREQPDWVVDLNTRYRPLQSGPRLAEPAPRLYAQKMLGAVPRPVPAQAGLASARLGVIDTGVDPVLAQPAVLNGSVVDLHSVLGPADKPAGTGHGSAVLQLMVGAAQPNGFAGAAPSVQLAWVNVMREVNDKPVTHSLALALALDWLMGRQVKLVNMSLGGRGDAVLKALVARVVAGNVTLLAAVGNNPASDAPAVYPAAYPGVWGITAVDAGGRLYSQATRATYTALAAPGVELWVPAGAGGAYRSGTSFASALAFAALAWQPLDFWAMPAAQRLRLACTQARKLEDHEVQGCGLVQVHFAP